MPTRYQLSESASATADASGTATASKGPARSFEKWQIVGIGISSTSSVNTPQVRIYRGAVDASRLVRTIQTGSLESLRANIVLQSGESLIAQWTGCDAGSSCTVTLSGHSIR